MELDVNLLCTNKPASKNQDEWLKELENTLLKGGRFDAIITYKTEIAIKESGMTLE